MSPRVPRHSGTRRKEKRSSASSASAKEGGTPPDRLKSPANLAFGSSKLQPAQFLSVLIFMGAAIAGTMIMLSATRQGISVFTDSTIYLRVARSLLQGQGFVQSGGAPLTHYPPLYPTVLALSGRLAGDLLTGAKWLQTILYVANLLLVGLLVYRGTNGSRLAAGFGLLFVLTSQSFLYCHVLVLSEGLFLFLTLVGLLFITQYLQSHSSFALIMATVVIGLACLTRYIGGTLVAGLLSAIVLLDRSDWRKKIVACSVVSAVFFLPIVVWLVRNLMLSSGLVNRTITYHPISTAPIQYAVETLWFAFLFPSTLHIVPKALILLTFTFFVIVVMVESINHFGIHAEVNRVPLICVCFLFVYAGGLVLAVLFVEPKLPFNARIMLPFIILLGIGLIPLWLNAFQLFSKRRALAVTVVALWAILLAGHGHRTGRFVDELRRDSMGFESREWQSSRVIEFVRGLPEDSLIYSNGPDVIDYFAGRRSRMIPHSHGPAGELREMVRHLEEAQGFLVYFDKITWRGYLIKIEGLKKYAELRAVYQGRDGAVYRVAKIGR